MAKSVSLLYAAAMVHKSGDKISQVHLPNHNTYNPRAGALLFYISRPKGLMVVSNLEFSADFENPFLKKILLERFSQIAITRLWYRTYLETYMEDTSVIWKMLNGWSMWYYNRFGTLSTKKWLHTTANFEGSISFYYNAR